MTVYGQKLYTINGPISVEPVESGDYRAYIQSRMLGLNPWFTHGADLSHPSHNFMGVSWDQLHGSIKFLSHYSSSLHYITAFKS